jgi:hypothetical protein
MTKLPSDTVEIRADTIGRSWDRAAEVATSEHARRRMRDNLRRGELSTVPRQHRGHDKLILDSCLSNARNPAEF